MTEKFVNLLNTSNESCSITTTGVETTDPDNEFPFSNATGTAINNNSNNYILDSLDLKEINSPTTMSPSCPELPNSPILSTSQQQNSSTHINNEQWTRLILKARKHSFCLYRIVLFFNWILSSQPSTDSQLWLSKENVLLINSLVLGYGSVYLHLSNFLNLSSQDLKISQEVMEQHNQKCEQKSNRIINQLHEFLQIWQDEFNFEQETSFLDMLSRVINQYNSEAPQFPVNLDVSVEELLAARGLDEAVNNDFCNNNYNLNNNNNNNIDSFNNQLQDYHRLQKQNVDYYRNHIRNKFIANNPPLVNYRNNQCFDEMLLYFNKCALNESRKAMETVGKLASVNFHSDGLVLYGSIRALLKLFESTFTNLLCDDKQRLSRIYDKMVLEDHSLYKYPFSKVTTTVRLESFKDDLKLQLQNQYQYYISLPIQCKSSYSNLQYLGDIIKSFNDNYFEEQQLVDEQEDEDYLNLNQFDFYNTLLHLYRVVKEIK